MGSRGHLLPFPQSPDGIELRHLRAFVAVADALNFGRAAERLCISQPALSRQIRTLEALVGTPLLIRSTHRVQLTVAGDALLQRARKLLQDVDEAVSATQAIGDELLARAARLLEPVGGLVGREGGLQEARDAIEDLLAHSSLPPDVIIRPVTAHGVQSLTVSPARDSEPTVLYLHGGAYVLGSAYGYRAQAGAVAVAAQTGVLVPDYRLAPEHPFPAALDDAFSAYRWLLDRGLDPRRLAVAGDSSGAGLVLSLLLRIRQERLALPGATVLFCPWVDLRQRYRVAAPRARAPLAATDEAQWCATAYLAGHPADDPLVDPLSADLTGLPPMLIEAAAGDARVTDAKALDARARTCGVDTQLKLYPVDVHAFQIFWSFLPEAADALEAAGSFLQRVPSGAPARAAVANSSPYSTALSSRRPTGRRSQD